MILQYNRLQIKNECSLKYLNKFILIPFLCSFIRNKDACTKLQRFIHSLFSVCSIEYTGKMEVYFTDM